MGAPLLCVWSTLKLLKCDVFHFAASPLHPIDAKNKFLPIFLQKLCLNRCMHAELNKCSFVAFMTTMPWEFMSWQRKIETLLWKYSFLKCQIELLGTCQIPTYVILVGFASNVLWWEWMVLSLGVASFPISPFTWQRIRHLQFYPNHCSLWCSNLGNYDLSNFRSVNKATYTGYGFVKNIVWKQATLGIKYSLIPNCFH